MRAFEILNEMVIRHREPDGDVVIAHRDSIWILNHDEVVPEEVSDDIYRRTGLPAEASAYDYFQHDSRPDVVMGSINDDTFHMNGSDSVAPNPASSILLKKLVKQLGLYHVSRSEMGVEDSEEETTAKWDMHGRIPDTMYHGTNSAFLREITRAGLAPNHNENWANVGKFYDRVFLSASLTYAMFHANRSASQGSAKDTYGAVPLIVVTKKLPDPNLIDLDFDVAGTYYGPNHERTKRAGYTDAMIRSNAYTADYNADRMVKAFSDKTDHGRETGIISYKGRIPASFISHYLVPGSPDYEKQLNAEAKRVEPNEVWDAVEMVQEYGYYDQYMERYEDDEDQDDDRQQEDDQDDDRY